MESVRQYQHLTKYLLDDLALIIIEYLHGTAEYQRYRNELNWLLEGSKAQGNAAYELLEKYAKSDQDLANLVRHNVLNLEVVMELFSPRVGNRNRRLDQYPLFIEELLLKLKKSDEETWIHLAYGLQEPEDAFGVRILTIERAMKTWKDHLSQDDYEKLVQIRKNRSF